MLRTIVLRKYLLDVRALQSLLESLGKIEVVCATTSMATAYDACAKFKIDVLIADQDSLAEADLAVDFHGLVRGLLLLVRNEELLSQPSSTIETKCLSLDARPADLDVAVRKLAGDASKVNHPTRDETPGRRGRNRSSAQQSLSLLTHRQRQVMQLIASGHSVRDTADILGLATSTVDNHKARLMKKLGIHKSSELTRLAIREGLIEL